MCISSHQQPSRAQNEAVFQPLLQSQSWETGVSKSRYQDSCVRFSSSFPSLRWAVDLILNSPVLWPCIIPLFPKSVIFKLVYYYNVCMWHVCILVHVCEWGWVGTTAHVWKAEENFQELHPPWLPGFELRSWGISSSDLERILRYRVKNKKIM